MEHIFGIMNNESMIIEWIELVEGGYILRSSILLFGNQNGQRIETEKQGKRSLEEMVLIL